VGEALSGLAAGTDDGVVGHHLAHPALVGAGIADIRREHQDQQVVLGAQRDEGVQAVPVGGIGVGEVGGLGVDVGVGRSGVLLAVAIRGGAAIGRSAVGRAVEAGGEG